MCMQGSEGEWTMANAETQESKTIKWKLKLQQQYEEKEMLGGGMMGVSVG